MYEKILVPLDGSTLAEQVLPHVQALAEKFGSAVILLHATLPPEELMPPGGMGLPMGDAAAFGNVISPQSVENIGAMLEAEKTAAGNYLAEVAARLKDHGFEVSTQQTDGEAAEVITEQARSIGEGIIAMTTHGRSGLARALVGSVADDVVRHSVCPVLLVRVSEKELKAD